TLRCFVLGDYIVISNDCEGNDAMPRPRGTGSVQQRKDGRWQGRYFVNKKAYYVYADTYAACNKLLLATSKAHKEQAKQKPRVLLRDFAKVWIESRVDYSANSREQRLDCIENHIDPDLGHLGLGEITREVVIEWVAKLAKKYKPATVRSNYICLG